VNELGLTPDEVAQAERIDEIARTELVAIAHRFGEQHAVCRELVDAMAAHGLFGLNIDAAYGGTSTSTRYSTLLCLAREQLGYHDPLVDFTFGCQGLGTVAIVRNGNADQRARYLPDLVSGNRLFAFALTEEGAGSDVRGMQTTAQRDGDTFVLNGSKTFISGAPEADVYVVLARTDGQPRSKGITAFIVERGTPGFTARQDITLSAPHAIGSLAFDGCVVPAANVIGQVDQGLAVAFGTLEVYRPSVGALAVGMGQRAYDLAVAYAGRRHVAGAPLQTLEAIRLKLARMWWEVRAARALVYRAAARRDAGLDSTREAAMAKLFATEAAHRAIYESQQIHGGLGVRTGQEVEALFRHIRQATIYEGTSEIQRSIIGRAESARAPGAAPDPPAGTAAGGPGDGLAVARGAYEDLRAWALGQPGLLARQAVQFRVADCAVALEAAELLAGGPGIPGGLPTTPAHAPTPAAGVAADVAVGHALAEVASLVDELHRAAGYLGADERQDVAAALFNAAPWSRDGRLLELAGHLLGPVG